MDKKLILGIIPVILLLIATIVMANGPYWASGYGDYSQGLRKNGNPVDPGRSDPNNALGPSNDDGPFFSLGYGGWIILEFENPVGGSLTVYEQTKPSGYPLETADVYVSEDCESWTYVGVADNSACGTGHPNPTTFDLEDDCISCVKIVDTTDPRPQGGTSDAFDVNSLSAEYECELNICELTGDDTVADGLVPGVRLGTNRWTFDGEEWVTTKPKGKGWDKSFSIEDTHGCNCEQILDWLHENYPQEYGEMKGHWKFGCSISVLEDFIALTE